METRAIWPRRNVSLHSTRPCLFMGQIPKLKLQKLQNYKNYLPVLQARSQNIWCLRKHKRTQIVEMHNGPCWGLWNAAIDGRPCQIILIIWADKACSCPSFFFFFATSCVISLPYCQLALETNLSTENTKIWVVWRQDPHLGNTLGLFNKVKNPEKHPSFPTVAGEDEIL